MAAVLAHSFSYRLRVREHLKLSNAGITLSLVIPATYVDYKCFGKQTLENIKRNWEKPDEVIFVITGTPDSEPKGFFQGTLTYDNQLSVPLLMSFTAKVANQATSKNNGARLAKGTLIQFFDMDDVLSPWAIFSVKRAYLLNPKPLAGIMFSHAPTSTVGVSRFSRVPSCTLDRKLCSGIAHARRSIFSPFCAISDTKCTDEYASRLYHDCFEEHVNQYRMAASIHWCCRSNGRQYLRPSFAAGWFLVRRSVMDEINFTTSLDIAEDGNFIGHILASGQNVLYVDIPIGFYNKRHDAPKCAS